VVVGDGAGARGRPAGGILTGDTVTLLAQMGLLGLPVDRYLSTTDERERLLLRAVTSRAVELVNKLNRK
jgi:hypothetical protein